MAVEAVKKDVESPPAKLNGVTVTLTTPVQAHGEMIKELKFRKPTGGDIMALGDGYPITINYQTGQILPNPPVMGMMMSTLAGVPPSTIRLLDAEDFSTCAFRLMGFFTPAG